MKIYKQFNRMPKELELWENEIPGSNGLVGEEIVNECIGNISRPSLFLFEPEQKKATGVSVIIMCGGGYGVVCIKDEANPTTTWLLENGITVFVLKYRLPNGHKKIPFFDAQRAIRFVRYNAKKWNLAPNKIGIWGFSAGGHLASSVATTFEIKKLKNSDPIDQMSCRPDFTILFYPVISLIDEITNKETKYNLLGKKIEDPLLVKKYSSNNNITEKTPPTFLLHCSDDLVVPVENSLLYYKALIKNKIAAEMLLFEKGGHGPEAFIKNPSWKPALKEWLGKRNCF